MWLNVRVQLGDTCAPEQPGQLSLCVSLARVEPCLEAPRQGQPLSSIGPGVNRRGGAALERGGLIPLDLDPDPPPPIEGQIRDRDHDPPAQQRVYILYQEPYGPPLGGGARKVGWCAVGVQRTRRHDRQVQNPNEDIDFTMLKE